MGGADLIIDELEKVLSSRRFMHSERMRRFLRFVVEKAVEEEVNELKEYVLAVEVFDRNKDFDPAVDSVVRVEARRLRTQLREYYADEGREDPIRIDIPKGGYAPEFKNREKEPGAGRSGPTGTVVVLPFADLSPSGDLGYLCDAFTERLTAEIAGIPAVPVVSRTSALAFKGKGQDVRLVGKLLGAETVLEGSVLKVGKKLRITVQLSSAEDGCLIWSQAYDRRLGDVLEVQDDVARSVVASVRGRLNPDKRLLARRTSSVPTAQEHYVKGRHHMHCQTEAGIKRAVWHFERALAADPDLAAAYAGLSHCYSRLGLWCILYPQEALRKSKTAALKAIELDGGLAEAHAALAAANGLFGWDWDKARLGFDRALELEPDSAISLQAYAMAYLLPMGRMSETVDTLQRAEELDPVSAFCGTMLGWAYYFGRQYDRAVEQFEKVLVLEPKFHLTRVGLGWVYEQEGMFDAAIRELQEARALAGGDPLTTGSLGHALGKAGREREAREIAEELRGLSNSGTILATDSAVVRIGLGETERAMLWLEKARDERCGRLCWLWRDPRFERLRSRKRFRALFESVGLEGVVSVAKGRK